MQNNNNKSHLNLEAIQLTVYVTQMRSEHMALKIHTVVMWDMTPSILYTVTVRIT
jgi:hypothetical protein